MARTGFKETKEQKIQRKLAKARAEQALDVPVTDATLKVQFHAMDDESLFVMECLEYAVQEELRKLKRLGLITPATKVEVA